MISSLNLEYFRSHCNFILPRQIFSRKTLIDELNCYVYQSTNTFKFLSYFVFCNGARKQFDCIHTYKMFILTLSLVDSKL